MKFGIIKERKNPPDRRVVFTPTELVKLKEQFPQAEIKVESSDIRVFSDEEYSKLGFEVSNDLTDCDVLIGVKEVPVDALIPNKKYFFFSHTIKKQPYNKKLLVACLEKNIRLIDHETIVNETNHRLIGFGRYAGIVGAYNGFRAFGIKFELFNLPKAETLADKAALVERLRRPMLPPIKIVLTGHGKVGMGAKEILDAMKIKEVSIEDYLTKTFDKPVYTQIDVLDYNKRKDGTVTTKEDFYQNPQEYVSDFERFTKVSDIFMAGHFYGNGAPVILTREMLNAPDNKIKVVADISCDVDGPIACTLRASTIAEPLYGYYPSEGIEVPVSHPGAVVVMAVDNLPCELPKDASEGFGEMFLEHVIPAFFNSDKDGILERAKITENGQLTARFNYLQDYVDGK
ncbi:monofunctional lysine-ketoglutarate reductase [Flavobacterium cauense R2A-7]|uniref:Saccharopine dehydrogenase [NAD(+), L-lysine-forming] n=1 Tax=Flavobacterium cauense R2A-7 TaxID=1341154 RepID=V6S3S6_9FLAO|nr:NAD(P)-dependent oxidoreductase [Flavobacterium cauense]ESU21311.1 monofunctional lysine-ketoglutarate reductase [Flavobacterium cauense R2A-7]KGO80041.1 alanine dehydrogenase [Flavobacterium cauense R2A-7]TWI08980.1 alanine dehydrogenase [Flavobacterium cauense R2A-7]